MKLDPRACSQLLRASNPIRLFGKVNKVVGLVAEGGGLRAPLGAVCHMLPDGESEGIAAEVVGFREGNQLFMPHARHPAGQPYPQYQFAAGLSCGAGTAGPGF